MVLLLALHSPFRCYCGPFPPPIRPSLFLTELGLGFFSPPYGVSRVNYLSLCTHPIATPRVLPAGACVAHFPTGLRPSPWDHRLGSHINGFEAFSAFSFHYGLSAR